MNRPYWTMSGSLKPSRWRNSFRSLAWMSMGRNSSTGSPLRRTRKKTAVSARKTTSAVCRARDRKYPRIRRVYPTALASARHAESGALEDMEPATAVDQVEEAARVPADVVAGNALFAVGDGRHERSHLPRRVRLGDVDDTKPVREPRHRDLGAGDFLARLMAARERRLG